MSTSKEFNWKTKQGGKIFAQKWLVDGKPKAIITLVHGLGEHIGRYDHVAKFFNQNQISFYGFDHRGHGKSSGIRGHIGDSQEFIEDIDTLVETSKSENPDVPIFLYGHSMGGNMVLFYAMKKQPEIKGVICTSPGIATGEPIPPTKLMLANLLKTMLPSLTMNNGLDVNNLSRNPQVVKAYQEDPLVHPMVSTKLAMDMFSNGDWIIANAEKFGSSLLLLQGDKDHIVNLEKTKQFASKVSSSLITFKIFPDFYHELHNELEQEQVLQYILNWINNQIL